MFLKVLTLVELSLTSAGFVPGKGCGTETPIQTISEIKVGEPLKPCTAVQDQASLFNHYMNDPSKAGMLIKQSLNMYSGIKRLSCKEIINNF